MDTAVLPRIQVGINSQNRVVGGFIYQTPPEIKTVRRSAGAIRDDACTGTLHVGKEVDDVSVFCKCVAPGKRNGIIIIIHYY